MEAWADLPQAKLLTWQAVSLHLDQHVPRQFKFQSDTGPNHVRPASKGIHTYAQWYRREENMFNGWTTRADIYSCGDSSGSFLGHLIFLILLWIWCLALHICNIWHLRQTRCWCQLKRKLIYLHSRRCRIAFFTWIGWRLRRVGVDTTIDTNNSFGPRLAYVSSHFATAAGLC